MNAWCPPWYAIAGAVLVVIVLSSLAILLFEELIDE